MEESKYVCPNCEADLTKDTNIIARTDAPYVWEEVELDVDGEIIYNEMVDNVFPVKRYFCCENCQSELNLTEAEVKHILILRNKENNEVDVDNEEN